MGADMRTLEWPREWYKFTDTQFNLRTVALSSRSVFTPRRAARLSFQMWTAQGSYKPERGPSEWSPKEAFFARLDGEVGLLRFTDVLRCQPTWNRKNKLPQEPWSDNTLFSDDTGWLNAGYIPPSALVAAAAVAGDENVTIAGLPPDLDMALSVGDLFEIRPNGIPTEHSNLYMVTRGSGTDTDGTAGVEIRPRLRQNIAAGDMVVLHRPMGVFKLTDSSQGSIYRDSNMGSFGFEVEEHVA